ncbi:MAG TPA: ribonuclease H [Candidatus Dormibacteraeota bacterium]|nr:ribonuclease H [Candidatus Dormibacteraeota bacterium]HVD02627.1 ribonuclease H [Candidatus Dormibacteraeota bacterium]
MTGGRIPQPEWVDAYSDGACSGNPGPGGWAFLIQWQEGVEEGSGGDPSTTNNRMELVGAREALAAFARRRKATQGLRLHVDSLNVIGWLSKGWKRNANPELYPPIDRLLRELSGVVEFVHVRGHQDSVGNNRVDRLAVEASRRYQRL